MAWELCLNTSTIMPQPMLDKIRLTAEAGFSAIELWVNDVYQYIGRGGEVRDIEKALSDYGLHVPCMIALRGWADAIPIEYHHHLDEARRRLELAARLGSKWLVCSPPREACPDQQVASRYADLLRLGAEVGVRPTFEYISFFDTIHSLDQAWSIVQLADDPQATFVLDAFHTWNGGSKPDLLATIPAERIAHYHIDDAAPDIPARQQKDPDRVMPGDGVIDLAAEIATLKKIGYQGAVSLELFNPTLWEQEPADLLRRGFDAVRELVGD